MQRSNVTADTPDRMPPQMWAFIASMVAGVSAAAFALAGALGWAVVSLGMAIGAGALARAWSRRSPAPMPHFIRWVLFLPRVFQSTERLKAILQPRPGARILEIGPGVGIHALPVAASLAPHGVLEALDIQRAMLDDMMRRARQAGVGNVRATVGDAQRLPYPDGSIDAAYLISVLGEIPDGSLALRELRRVLKPGGRLVVSEIVVDPDFISLESLKERAAAAGFVFERRLGPGLGYFASFRPAGDGVRLESCRA